MALPSDPAPITASEFLGRFFDGVDGWMHVFAIDRVTADRHIRWAHTDDPVGLIKATKPFVATSCIWFGVAPRRRDLGPGHRGESDDCLGIPALWLDIDITGPNHAAEDLPPTREAGLELLGDFPVPPSILVDTGGGYQAYWLLQELLPLDDAKALLNRWGATWDEKGRRRGWHVDNVFDVARIMRLPASYNRKSAPVHVDIVHADWDRRYTPDDLDQWCIDPPAPVDTTTRRTVPYIGPERPGDAYNAVTDAGRMLEGVGWEFDHVDRSTGARHYRAPHHTGERGTTGATVYVDGHTTLWSETFARRHGMQIRRPYDPFGLYTNIHHHGDWQAASVALFKEGYGASWVGAWTTAEAGGGPAAIEVVDLSFANLVDWPPFWANDHTGEDWLASPIIPRGRAIALYAPAKAGKSSVALAITVALATGRPIFGRWPCEPTSILYLDYEMIAADLQERLIELGYSEADDLSNLHYALLPMMPPLDTAEGARAVLALASHFDAQLIVVDTFGRSVQGDEDKADTVRDFYRHTGQALKAAGRAVLRSDHSGKDLERGQRGTSAKADDVDVVWRLTRTEQGVSLKRTHSRLSWVPETVNLNRHETNDGIAWGLVDEAYPTGTKEVADLLDRLDVPITASARASQNELKAAGCGRRMTLIIAAQRWRQEIAMSTFASPKPSGNTPGNTPSENGTETPSETNANALLEAPGKHSETPSESYRETVHPPIGGCTLPGPPADDLDGYNPFGPKDHQ